MKIQMVDLKGQYEKIKDEITKSMEEVLEKTSFIHGPQVGKFEEELANYLKVSECVSCANGTDALQIAFMALGLKAGDEIIVPAFTYIAPVEAAALLGLKVVLADCDERTFNLSPVAVEKVISSRTKAIVPVHLFGQCANMEAILDIASRHGLLVVEDAAQAAGAVYTFKNKKTLYAGTMGAIGTTSFFPSKNLGCYGDGGALFTDDKELSKKIRMIANHGQAQKYVHEMVGVNSRLDTLQAAILRVKLSHLPSFLEARQKAASFYNIVLGGHPSFDIPLKDPSCSHVFHQFTIIVKNGKRDELKNHLASKGIPSMVYYPEAVHYQKGYQNLGYKKGDFPVAEKLSSSVLSLPMHTELTEEQLNYITETILQFFT